MSRPRSCLLLDDDAVAGLTFEMILDDAGFRVVRVDSLAAARTALEAAPYDLFVLDVHLPDGLGPDLIPALKRAAPDAAVVVLSGSIEVGRTFEGADRVLAKGIDPQVALDAIEAALARRGGST